MKKIAIVGAGNAGCLTALHYHFWEKDNLDKITIYHDPDIPIEKVGQGSALGVTDLLFNALNIDFVENNPIKATLKSGIMYENWGKRDMFHNFPLSRMGCHYVPSLLSDVVLNSGLFNVIEKKIEDPEEEIDSDWIFDCRGKTHKGKRKKLNNPINSVLLAKKPGNDPTLTYTRCVATPDGWTFIIPNLDSVSYGYLFNNTITTSEEASKNFTEMFDVVSESEINFENYIERNIWHGKRTCLNGNRLSFLEPLEASSTGFHLYTARESWDHIIGGKPKADCNLSVQEEMKRIENFVLWHYEAGSKFDTPFWEYTKKFQPVEDIRLEYFKDFVSESGHIEQLKLMQDYSQWSPYSINKWMSVF